MMIKCEKFTNISMMWCNNDGKNDNNNKCVVDYVREFCLMH